MLPIAIIAFNRPDYLAKALDSLVGQSVKLDRVALFQDGPRRQRDVTLITEGVYAFRKRFPEGEVFQSGVNLGPALNIDRAERWLFEDLGVSVGAIFEDDMVVSPYYVSALIGMLYATRDDERVAYVSAYGPIWPVNPGPANSYVPMHLNWAFAITKHQWLKRKPYVDQYLDIVRGADYRERDIVAIMKLRDEWGLSGVYTTQDVMRSAATRLVGGIRLGTRAHLARYIGARGLHLDEKTYDAAGIGKIQIYPKPLRGFGKVDERLVEWCHEWTDRFIGFGYGSEAA